MNSTPQQQWWSFTHNAMLTQGVVISPSFIPVFYNNQFFGSYPHTYVPQSMQTEPTLTSILEFHEYHVPNEHDPLLLILHSALLWVNRVGRWEVEVEELSRRFRLALMNRAIREMCGLTPWVVVRGPYEPNFDFEFKPGHGHYTLRSLAAEPQLSYTLHLYRDRSRLFPLESSAQYVDDMAVVCYC
ncbi:hypothetical protein Hypma_006365 [Hypsizygus marmoreus]|uniref:Uncharacterized protein n=1 Tax=Hypsizygus marmoreus TaxID=39966 RepID=A0A369JUA1_HYPMA|nr:hypothetical protein Hypma_006365 [Hypsizygus marmoreus]